MVLLRWYSYENNLIFLRVVFHYSSRAQTETTLSQLIDSTKYYWSKGLNVAMTLANRALATVDSSGWDNYVECLKNKGAVNYLCCRLFRQYNFLG